MEVEKMRVFKHSLVSNGLVDGDWWLLNISIKKVDLPIRISRHSREHRVGTNPIVAGLEDGDQRGVLSGSRRLMLQQVLKMVKKLPMSLCIHVQLHVAEVYIDQGWQFSQVVQQQISID